MERRIDGPMVDEDAFGADHPPAHQPPVDDGRLDDCLLDRELPATSEEACEEALQIVSGGCGRLRGGPLAGRTMLAERNGHPKPS